jgi:hypothetical protein
VDVAGADWTAIGSIAGGFGTVAAFLAIMVTIAVYFFQNRGEKAAAVRQNLQFLHGQQIQVVPSIAAGLLAIMDRQIREFRERLGQTRRPDISWKSCSAMTSLPATGSSSGRRRWIATCLAPRTRAWATAGTG